MMLRFVTLLAGVVLVGCASIGEHTATRPPVGRSAADAAAETAQCEAYAKAQEKDRGEHYQACMVSKGHTVNIGLDKLGWIVAVTQTRAHEPSAILQDIPLCDVRADNAKNADIVTVAPEQERMVSGQTHVQSSPWPYQSRPNASRMLVSCLSERGYAIAPPLDIRVGARP